MILKLLKKEFSLCLHPTAIFFLAFCAFVLIPNYPYEVMFFFAGLSVFFVCLSARENQDLSFSCTLPVNKRAVAISRVLFSAIFQTLLLALAGAMIAVKECCSPPEMQINLAGSAANFALLGHGGVLLGAFNLIFFPLYFKNPAKVGVPFVIAAAVQFVLIAGLVLLRFVAPVYSDLLATSDPANMGIKAIFFSVGILFYFAATALSAHLSGRRFEKTDL